MSVTISLSVKNPKKISVVLRQDLIEELQALAEYEGRSLSNMCAFILEQKFKQQQSRPEERQ